MTELAAAATALGGGPKKKFATPPVKIACLACRASRTRCDGGHPCSSCESRTRECVYRPSKRGGARVRRKARLSEDVSREQLPLPTDMPAEEVPQQPIAVENYIEPGAGLKQLQDWFQDSDFIFDSLFMTDVPNSSSGGDSTSESSFGIPSVPVPIVRTYKSDAAILDAYYIFIHPFFPILPAPYRLATDHFAPHFQNDTSSFEDDFEPSTPISLAICAVLALIPCPNDLNHLSQESVVFRRKYAQFLAQSAIESIEIESEIPDSSVEPTRALNEEPSEFMRQAFHPGLPVNLESIVALDILSVYEYAQRGNLKKMQSRAGQALVSAMALSIHTASSDDDEFCEAKRRVFWMTYICVCQGAIVSNSEPTFAIFAPSFTAQYPIIQADPDAFAIFIKAQQAILAATQFVIELNKTVKASADMTRIYERMKELELFLEPLGTQSDSWALQSTATSPVDPSEQVVSRSLRCIARIKLNSARIKIHRYCAFFDMPVFSGKHCDLKSKSDKDDGSEPRSWPACSCSSLIGLPSSSPSHNGSVSPQAAIMKLSPDSEDLLGHHAHTSFPFSSHESARICLKAALNIASSFTDLPYPNPSGQITRAPAYLSPTSSIISPRTMPSFACCAMQCAYALLMVNHKTKATYPEIGSAGPLVDSLLLRLQQGLTSISITLENYATAFEALGGMRDQIQSVIEPSMMFNL